MKAALKEAKKAYKKGEVPVGCVIVKNGKIIAKGHNKKEGRRDPLAHAEMIAIRKASKRLSSWRLLDTVLYVTLEPCAMCAGGIISSRIPRVVFGIRDEKAGALVSTISLLDNKSLNHHPKVTEGVLKEESKTLMEEFFKDIRKRKTKEQQV